MWVQLAAITTVLMFGAQFVVFLRWLHRRMRDDEITRVFVRDLARNHLPLLYSELHRICDHMGIEYLEMPAIEFVDFHGVNGRARKVR
jgi:hypothetical protein